MTYTTIFEARSRFHGIRFGDPSPGTASPALVFLHGSGERGSDLSLLTRHGLPALLQESRASVNCPVYCPQLESEAHWASDRVVAFLDALRPVHRSLVLIGYSWGGMGVCKLLATEPVVLACAIVIAGQSFDRVQGLRTGSRLVTVQGELDDWADTATFAQAMRAAGAEVQALRLANQGHFIAESAMFLPAVTELLAAHNIRLEMQATVDQRELPLQIREAVSAIARL